MRGLIGGIILVAGVGGLGWYATQGPAVAMQAQIADAAAVIADGTQHPVAVAVSGRDITVTGTAEDDTELAALEAAFDGITGRRVVHTDGLSLLPVVSPYTLDLEKSEDGVTYNGHVPNAAVQDTLGDPALIIANGEPDPDWGDAASTVADAMSLLDSGTAQISDTDVTVTGIAADPTALAAFNDAMTALPATYRTTSDIDVADDGTPLRLSLQYDGETLSGSGKIPADMARDAVSVGGADTSLDIQSALAPSADGQWPAFATAGITALGALDDGRLEIENQSLTLTGTGAPKAIETATAALADLPDGFVAQVDVMVADDGAPFTLMATKTANGITAEGKVPSDFTAADLPEDAGHATAFVIDETGIWPSIGEAGVVALAALDEGVLTVTSEAITLTGTAASAEARDTAVAALASFSTTTDITVPEIIAPIGFDLTYSIADGAAVTGTLPAFTSPGSLSAVLGVPVADDATTQSTARGAVDTLSPLAAIQPLLQEMTRFTYAVSDSTVSLAAVAEPGVEPDQLNAALASATGDSVRVSVDAQDTAPVNGTRRTNPFTLREEVFTDGFWLPVFDFFTTPESCSDQTAVALSDSQVSFLTGSAELDVPSTRAINAIAALVRKCALEGGVFLQVEGHTDNTGDADANLALSQARADAVRDAILERGVAQVAVSAVGLGDTQPIADNDTEAGRAANRRTEFNWNFE